ncbi:MAG: hypothetical protein ACK5JE_11855 [Castellaniella sp.]|uniref:hypothetical protein n=1 Tax=Castellaniella sp. TaxID=1955812 RepID=UPI003A8431C3
MSTRPAAYSDAEIARYVLGLHTPERVADIQSRLACDNAAAARALKWEAYFLGIVDALPPEPVPDAVLSRICQSLGMDMEAASVMGETRPGAVAQRSVLRDSPPRRPRRGPRLRRGRVALALGLAIALGLAALVLWASLQPAPVGTVVQHPVELENR